MLYAVVYANCFVVHECAVSRRYINVCSSDVFGIVNIYLDHLMFYLWLLMVEGMSVECYFVSNECDRPTSCLVPHIGTHGD